MRRKICIGLLILCTIFLQLLNPSLDAKALDFRETGERGFETCTIDVAGFPQTGVATLGRCAFISSTDNYPNHRTGWVNGFNGTFSPALPGKSLIILSGRYVIPGDKHNFVGFSGTSQLSVVFSSFNHSQNSNNYTTSFTYVLYTPYPLSNIAFDSPGAMWQAAYETRIDISKINYITLTDEPTQQQINALSGFISTVNNSVLTGNNTLTDIESLTQDIKDYLEDKEDQEQDDRDNIEQQSSSTETDANEQGDEATQTGTSLFSAFTQLLGALTNVNGNSCTLPAMQVYSLNLGNMNLCQYDIPPQIMALVSIGMVFIIIPLGINLVKRMISLYKEITG